MTETPLIRVRGTCSDGETCPAVHFDPVRDEFVMRGYLITDPRRLVELDLPPGEGAVRLPASMFPELRATPC